MLAQGSPVTAVLLIAMGVHVASPPGSCCPLPSHDAGLNVLADALVVVVVVIGPAGRGVERRNAVEVEDEVLPVTHGRGVVLVSRESHWKEEADRNCSETSLSRWAWGGVFF